MERYTNILGLEESILSKLLYYIRHSWVQIQCNLYQIANGIFCSSRTEKNLKICVETYPTPNTILAGAGRINFSDFTL